MNKLQIFKNKQFGEIRTTIRNGEPYLMLNDTCRTLGLNNVSQAKSRLNPDGVITNEVIDSLGRTQLATFVNESNFYKVVFQSRKPQAEEYTEWVTSEVLPSIRKHGGYIANQEKLTPEQLMAKALIVAQSVIEEKDKLIEQQKPKVLFAEALEVSDNSILVGELAKLLKQNGINIGQNRLFDWLRTNGFLMTRGESRNMPTQYSMERGLFEIKVRTINNPDGSLRETKTPKVTGKGQIYFVNRLMQEKEVALG